MTLFRKISIGHGRSLPASAAAAVMAMLAAATLTAQPAHALVKLGTLTCDIAAGTSMVLFSSKRLNCVYHGASGKRTRYVGRITRFGLDIGSTGGGHLAWAVFALGDHRRGALEGSYVGASAEITAGAGVGANALVGGFRRSIVLQPLSVQGQTGVSLAAGIAGMELERR